MMAKTRAITLEEFTEHVREHHTGLRAYIRSLGAHPDWVDDVAQEAFLIAWQKMKDFDPERSFGGWIRGIAENILMNERSKAGNRGRILSEKLRDILHLRYGQREAQETSGHAQDLMGALSECMEMLPPKSKALLQHRYEQKDKTKQPPNTPTKEIPMSADSIRQTLFRIRVKLKGCIQQRLGESTL